MHFFSNCVEKNLFLPLFSPQFSLSILSHSYVQDNVLNRAFRRVDFRLSTCCSNVAKKCLGFLYLFLLDVWLLTMRLMSVWPSVTRSNICQLEMFSLRSSIAAMFFDIHLMARV